MDAACNPYLAFAVILAAGLKGIEGDYELPPGAEDDVWALTSAERRALGIRPLPQDLDQAIRVMHIYRLVDKPRNTIIYLAISTKIINGSPANAISTVPIMQWQR